MISCDKIWCGYDDVTSTKWWGININLQSKILKEYNVLFSNFLIINCENEFKINNGNNIIFNENYINDQIRIVKDDFNIKQGYLILLLNQKDRCFYDFGLNVMENFIKNHVGNVDGHFMSINEWIVKQIIE